MSQKPRSTTRYHYKVGNRISHTGITKNPARRQAQHQRNRPGGRLVKQGPKVTHSSALRWERIQGLLGRPTRGYR